MTPRQRQWLKSLATVASTTVHLSRASSPVAWVSAGISLLSEAIGDTPNEPLCWPHAPWSVRAAILAVAVEARLGKVISTDREGDEIREYEGCRFGHRFGDGREWSHGPSGDATALPRWIWEHLGSSIQIASGPENHSTMEGIALRPDPLDGVGLGAIGRQAASEISALRRDGKRAGVLFEGVRGGGKSWTMRAIAAELGGFSLRGRLAELRDDQVLGFVDVLAPKTVIFDDIDRGRTAQALDLVEILTSRGIVVLASCNRTSKVDDSLIRARRLGLHYRLESIDAELLSKVIGDRSLDDGILALLRERTVAEVAEFVDHLDSLGQTRAVEIMQGRQDGSVSAEVSDPPLTATADPNGKYVGRAVTK